jgi:dephospho-CoA kinase
VKDYLLEKLEEAKRSGKVKLFFVEAALLIECGYGELVDEMWYVHARKSVRRKRLKESRGYSDEKIDQIMKAQLSEEAFRKGSDFVIDNGGELTDACSAIDEHLKNMDA